MDMNILRAKLKLNVLRINIKYLMHYSSNCITKIVCKTSILFIFIFRALCCLDYTKMFTSNSMTEFILCIINAWVTCDDNFFWYSLIVKLNYLRYVLFKMCMVFVWSFVKLCLCFIYYILENWAHCYRDMNNSM